jgi:hypothetical protein
MNDPGRGEAVRAIAGVLAGPWWLTAPTFLVAPRPPLAQELERTRRMSRVVIAFSGRGQMRGNTLQRQAFSLSRHDGSDVT